MIGMCCAVDTGRVFGAIWRINMDVLQSKRALATAVALALAPSLSHGFSSGSTGADGALNPLVNMTIPLPSSGIFNYTSVNIPVGVTVKFLKNAANTPVVILATSDVTIAGTLDVSGQEAPGVGAGGGGNPGDDGLPGKGGPAGFDGGKGGTFGTQGYGGAGAGPGAGNPGFYSGNAAYCIPYNGFWIYWATGGTGAGFGSAAVDSGWPSVDCPSATPPFNHLKTKGGTTYGTSLLLPLIGGSGGGGGGGGRVVHGGGGGGGGGALLIAASGSVNVSGAVLSRGGHGGTLAGSGGGGDGGGGAGGAIRIIATLIAGNGTISAIGGSNGGIGEPLIDSAFRMVGTAGAVGRIRLEGDTITRTEASSPTASVGVPGPIFLANLPALAITSVAGVAAPPNPTGSADITLPANTPNLVTVVFATTNVPLGNTVKLTLTPQLGNTTEVISPALTGTTASATASVQVTLPTGPSVLLAQTTYTIVAALGQALSRFAGNEPVERITLSASPGGVSRMTLITASGKAYEASGEAVRIASAGGQ